MNDGNELNNGYGDARCMPQSDDDLLRGPVFDSIVHHYGRCYIISRDFNEG